MQLNSAENVRSQAVDTSSGIRALPAILVAMALLMLFALSSHYKHDALSAESYKQWNIGVGPAHWLSVSRHGNGPQNATTWEPFQLELHASWLAPVLLVLLIVVSMIRHRVMSRQGLTLGEALVFQLQRRELQMPRLPVFVSQLPRHLLNAIVIAAGAGLAINLTLPVPVHHSIELTEPATAEQMVERLEPALNESLPGFTVRIDNIEQDREQVIIEGRRFLFGMNNQLSTMIGETGLTAGSRHSVKLSSHPAALPVGLFAGALVLLLGWRGARDNKRKLEAT